MKYILLFLLLTTSLFSQKKTSYDVYTTRMNAKAISNFNITSEVINKHKELAIINHWVKITMKTRLNRNVTDSINSSNNIDGMIDNLEPRDYFSLAAYNIRSKIYLTKKVRFVNNILITGINAQTYLYTFGFVVKF